MWDTVVLVDHLLPIVITAFIVLAMFSFFVGMPYLHYISLVANATNDTGIIKLAKYLAHKAGGRGINVDHAWESFIPAAKEIRLSYIENRINKFVEDSVTAD